MKQIKNNIDSKEIDKDSVILTLLNSNNPITGKRHTYSEICSIVGCSKSRVSKVKGNGTKKSTGTKKSSIRDRSVSKVNAEKQLSDDFLWRVAWNMIGESMDDMREVRKLTKSRFLAEMLGYRGKSLTLDKYKEYIVKEVGKL